MEPTKLKSGTVCGSLLAALLLFSTSSIAQPSDAYVSMKATAVAGTVHGVYYIELADTNSVNQIEIKLGTDWTSADLVNVVFTYDSPGSLPQGYSYSRNGNIIAIDMGNFPGQASYYGNVRTKNGATWSNNYTFVSN